MSNYYFRKFETDHRKYLIISTVFQNLIVSSNSSTVYQCSRGVFIKVLDAQLSSGRYIGYVFFHF